MDELLIRAEIELEQLNKIKDEILFIPDAEMKDFLLSGFEVYECELDASVGEPDSSEKLIEAWAKFERWCKASPMVTPRALVYFSLAYALLVDVFFSEKHEPSTKISNLDALLYSNHLRGAFLGSCDGYWKFGEAEIKAVRSHFSKVGTASRHKDSRADKEHVFAWLDSNFITCKSMDDAAMKMAEKQVATKFRAVRRWVTEWKKLRSAGTA